MILTFDQLEKRYEDVTATVTCDCVFSTDMVGGQPATEAGIAAFVTHHLKITDPVEAAKAVQRILREEVGERDTTPDGGEIQEKKVYGLNVVRRTEHGPYLGNWMVKACLKQAASQLYIPEDFRRSKGHWSEAGRVRAIGVSLLGKPEEIYLRNADGTGPAETNWQSFKGRVNTPNGAKSICHDSECVPAGSRFAFEFRFLVGKTKIKENDVADVIAMAMMCGLGSAKAMDRGKFRVLSCSIELPAAGRFAKDEPKAKKETKSKAVA